MHMMGIRTVNENGEMGTNAFSILYFLFHPPGRAARDQGTLHYFNIFNLPDLNLTNGQRKNQRGFGVSGVVGSWRVTNLCFFPFLRQKWPVGRLGGI